MPNREKRRIHDKPATRRWLLKQLQKLREEIRGDTKRSIDEVIVGEALRQLKEYERAIE